MEEKFDELKKYVCRNGTLLQSTCFLVDSLRTSKEESFLKIILDQSTRDLKASMFLAFSGHYRQAMQVLRCSFENLISGVYFHSDLCELRKRGGTTEEFKRLEKRFNEWEKGGRVNIRGNIEVLRRIGFLSLSEEKSWRELYRNLSKFIHTPKEYICRMKHKEMANIETVCPASTYFSVDSLRTWSNSFQMVFVAILKSIVEYHPFVLETKSGKIAIKDLLPIIKDLRIPLQTQNLLIANK